ncbi:MAG: Tm-1-like ATP-binding domain-containing protein [Gemmataceae bacterium]
MSVLLIGTLDTKGAEIGFVRDRLRESGVKVFVMDAGALGMPATPAEISREDVFRAAGTTLEAVRSANDRGNAVTLAAAGAAKLASELHAKGELSGVLSLGGSAGTTIGTAAMRALPLGVPKLMVSTLASGQVQPYVGTRDVMMLHSVVDISGLNRISTAILGNAAAAMAGMVCSKFQVPSSKLDEKPIIAATMFGVTTPCVEAARKVLEAAGYEVLVFHATGTGGRTMEGLIADGLVAGVLDITTTELVDELAGGILSAGPERLTAAAKAGIPQVISVGALDMVNFGPPETIPPRYADRLFYRHNPNVTLMRTTAEEMAKVGEEIARKANASIGPTAVMLPLRGVSAIDAEGKPFWQPEADAALLAAIRGHVDPDRLVEMDCHINDAAFAEACAARLLAMLTSSSTSKARVPSGRG